MTNRELTKSQALRIEKAEAITREQLARAKAIVTEQYNGYPEAITIPITAALVQAMATNYLAVVHAASAG